MVVMRRVWDGGCTPCYDNDVPLSGCTMCHGNDVFLGGLALGQGGLRRVSQRAISLERVLRQ